MRIVGGIHRNKFLATPKGGQTRPTSGQLRECLFNICQNYIEGASFLDLFAGSGAMGIEALSRGASQATFIERDKEASSCIRKNVEALQLTEQAIIFNLDILQGLKYLARREQQFNIIYSDPPYKDIRDPTNTYNEMVLEFIDKHSLLAPDGILFLENPLESPTVCNDLKAIELKSSRRLGRAILEQYSHVKIL